MVDMAWRAIFFVSGRRLRRWAGIFLASRIPQIAFAGVCPVPVELVFGALDVCCIAFDYVQVGIKMLLVTTRMNKITLALSILGLLGIRVYHP